MSNIKELLEIDAFIYGDKIGTLIFNNNMIYFAYDSAFRDKNIQISPIKLNTSNTPDLYINTDERFYQGIAGVFYDSLPDDFGMTFIFYDHLL